MNYLRSAEIDLREYLSIKNSLTTLPEELAEVNSSLDLIKAVTYDSTPVEGGASTYEDRIINELDRKNRLELNLRIAKSKVRRIEKGLELLDERERTVLWHMYITGERNSIDYLCQGLNYDRATVYRIKSKALLKFTRSMWGVIDI